MAYNPRYEFYFRDDTDARRLYRTWLCDRDYNGGIITEVQHNGNPVRIRMKASDDRFEVIRGMVAEIGTVADPDGVTIFDLYTEDGRKWKVVIDEISEGSSIIRNVFTGYLSPFEASEAYAQKPFPAKLTASCGIGSLKDYPFNVAGTSRPAVAKFSMFYVLRTCLSWLGYELPLHISIGLIEKSMATHDVVTGYKRPIWPYSTLASINMDAHRFLTDTGIESCHEVLTDILKTMEATIVQDRGAWRIVRIPEYAQYIADGGNVPVLVYPKPSNHQFDGGIENMIRTIGPSGIGIPEATGEISIAPSEKRISINFDYGDLYNELKNGDFSQGLTHWTSPVPHVPAPPPGRAVADGDGSQEKPFGIKILGTSSDYRQREDLQYAVQAYMPEARPEGSTEELTLKLTFINIKNGGAKFAVHAISNQEVYSLQEDGTWGWYGGSKDKVSWYIFKRNTYKDLDGRDMPKPTEGETVEISMSPIPGKGAYILYVYLHRGLNLPAFNNDPTAYTVFRNITLTKKDLSRLDLKGEIVKAEVPSDRKRDADSVKIRLGDQTSAKRTRTILLTAFPATYQYINVYYFRYGALLRGDGTATDQWLAHGANPNDPAAWKRIQQHIALDHLRMTGKPAQVFSGTLVMRDPSGEDIGPLDILHFQELDTPAAKCYMLPLRGWDWDIKANKVTVDAVEVLGVPNVNIKSYWDSPSGTVPMDDAGEVPKPRSKFDGVKFTPGQLLGVLGRQPNGVVGKGAGFTFNPDLGIPIKRGFTPGNILGGQTRLGLINLFRKHGN